MSRQHLCTAVCASVAVLALAACSSSSSSGSVSEDTSTSGTMAEEVGGAISGSSSDGTISLLERRSQNKAFALLNLLSSPLAHASTPACPTLVSANSSGANTCSSTSNVATLDYSDCSFGTSPATWNGLMAVSFSGATSLSCGTFPTPTNDTLRRQVVASVGGAAGETVTRTSVYGTQVTVDDSTSGIDGNYQSDTFDGTGASGFHYTTSFNSGGGKEVLFSSGKRTSATIVEHLSAKNSGISLFDHTVAGTVNLTESGSGASTSWIASSGTVTGGACSGGMTIYHNLIKVMGQTCFENVTYNTTCCTPVSGTIVTTFTKTSASPSNLITNAMNGKSESLAITGCGTATYTNYTGGTSSVALDQCY